MKLKPENLDDVVHDTASNLATNANNGGLENQIEFLVNQLGTHETKTIIDSYK